MFQHRNVRDTKLILSENKASLCLVMRGSLVFTSEGFAIFELLGKIELGNGQKSRDVIYLVWMTQAVRG